MVVVVDDEDRENEGDLILPGEKATPAAINFMARFGRGLICVPTTGERLAQLGIEQMVANNEDTLKTDFQVSVDAARNVTTGISAADAERDGVLHLGDDVKEIADARLGQIDDVPGDVARLFHLVCGG